MDGFDQRAHIIVYQQRECRFDRLSERAKKDKTAKEEIKKIVVTVRLPALTRKVRQLPGIGRLDLDLGFSPTVREYFN